MITKAKSYAIKKTFGIDVLLKLTKASTDGLEASESNGNYTFNVSVDELSKAVNTTLKNHNINLLVT